MLLGAAYILCQPILESEIPTEDFTDVTLASEDTNDDADPDDADDDGG